MNRFLLVRLSALGDIIHALPVAAALREAYPDARIDWLVSSRHREILDHVTGLDRRVILQKKGDTVVAAPSGRAGRRSRAGANQVQAAPAAGAWNMAAAGRKAVGRRSTIAHAVNELREADYDVAFDLQGLMKSAVLARSSGARRVIGFATAHLRERWAHLFYTETVEPPSGVHVIDKNLSLLEALGLRNLTPRFPLAVPESECVEQVRALLASTEPALSEQSESKGTEHVAPHPAPSTAPGTQHPALSTELPFMLLNPSAGWPNKRWPPEWFGAIAARVRDRHGMGSIVLWGPGEESLARQVVELSHGAAHVAPPTGIADMIALAHAASLFISGDTGPLHIAAAVGTPIVGIYGPTSPARNGPWSSADVCVSRFDACKCHHRRRCRLPVCCLLDITVDAVMDAVERRLVRATLT